VISKLHHILAFVSCAALAGCALETNAGEDVSQGQADLKKADDNSVAMPARTPCTPGDGVTISPQPVDVVKVIKTDNLLGNPGTDEGPRPHPWQPAPEEGSTNTSTNTGSSTDTSDKPAK
jgi:hypothetical protein